MEEPEPEKQKGEKQKEPKASTSTSAGLNVESSDEYEEIKVDCPATPERMPPGSTTPPPAAAVLKESRRKRTKRRTRSLDRSLPNSPSSSSPGPNDADACSICLGAIQNKAKTDSCFHEFCFTCLVEWSKVKPVCPLCKSKFTHIMHNIVSDTDYQRYDLPPQETREEVDYPDGNALDFFFNNHRRFFSYHSTRHVAETRRRDDMLRNQLINFHLPSSSSGGRRSTSSRHIFRTRRGPGTSDFRRQIYQDDMWVQPMTDEITGRYRNCSPEWYRTNEAQIHRLIPFLNRELLALLANGPHQSQQSYLVNQISEWVTRVEIQSPEMRDNLLPYLGLRTEHFQHEFYNFARSTYDLVGYDRNAEYQPRRLPAAEVVSSGSDNSDVDVGNNEDRTAAVDPLATARHLFSDNVRAFNVVQSAFQVLNPSGHHRHRSRRRDRDRFGDRRARSADRDHRYSRSSRTERNRDDVRSEGWSRWRKKQRERIEGRRQEDRDRSDSRHSSSDRHRNRQGSSSDRHRHHRDREQDREKDRPSSSRDRGSHREGSSKDQGSHREGSSKDRGSHREGSLKDRGSPKEGSSKDRGSSREGSSKHKDKRHHRHKDSRRRDGSSGSSSSNNINIADPLRPFPASSSSSVQISVVQPTASASDSYELFPRQKPDVEERMRQNAQESAATASASTTLDESAIILTDSAATVDSNAGGSSTVNDSVTIVSVAGSVTSDDVCVDMEPRAGASSSESVGQTGAASTGQQRKEGRKERSKRKSSKPSRFLRHQRDLAQNFPHLLSDDSNDGSSSLFNTTQHNIPTIDLSKLADLARMAEKRQRAEKEASSNSQVQTIEVLSSPTSKDETIDVVTPIDLSVRSSLPGTSTGIIQIDNTVEYPLRIAAPDSSDDENPVKNPQKNILPNGDYALSERTGLLEPVQDVDLVPPLMAPLTSAGTTLSAPSSDDELAIVEEVAPKQRKQKEPEIVELSDSEDEVEAPPASQEVSVVQPVPQYQPPVAYDPNAPIEISSGSDSEGENDLRLPTPPESMRQLVDNFTQGYDMYDSYWTTGPSNYVLQEQMVETVNYDNMGPKKKRKKAAPSTPPPDSSDDDLIVVKTEHNTIDPITKKEIEEPVKNKLCGHVYEKSSIYSMIELARSQSKSVRCPYLGCNQKDFTKKDLLKDKEVKEHIEKVRDEREEEARVKKEKEAEKRKQKEERRAAGDVSDSGDSIIEDGIEMIKDDHAKGGDGDNVVATEEESPSDAQTEKKQDSADSSDNSQSDDTTSHSSDTSLPSLDPSSNSSASPGRLTVDADVDVAKGRKRGRKKKRNTIVSSDDARNTEDEPDNDDDDKQPDLDDSTSTNDKEVENDSNHETSPEADDKVDVEEEESEKEKEKDNQDSSGESGADRVSDQSMAEPNARSDQPLVERTARRKRKLTPDFFASDSDSDEEEAAPPPATIRRKPKSTTKEKSNSKGGSSTSGTKSSKVARGGRKVTIKKVTETWCYEEEDKSSSSNSKKAKPRGRPKGKGKTTAVVNDDENNAKTSEGSPKKGKGKNSPSKKGKGVSCGKSSKKRPRRAAQSTKYTEKNTDSSDEEYDE